MKITRGFSLTNFFVATSALGFQVLVLYPWHKRLDEDFEALKKEHLRVLHLVEGVYSQDAKDALRPVNKSNWIFDKVNGKRVGQVDESVIFIKNTLHSTLRPISQHPDIELLSRQDTRILAI
jgi:hypothetical protein